MKPIKISDIRGLTNSFEEVSIYCHPDNFKFLQNIADEINPKDKGYNFYNSSGFWSPPLGAIQIFTDKHLEKYSKKWVFPVCPAHWTGNYWEYTKEDEEWARPIGHGKWVYTDEPIFYMIKKPKLQFSDIYRNTSVFDIRKSILNCF
jgi:hypothetical protein